MNLNLRNKPSKEAFSLLDTYIDEKEKQCASHNDAVKKIEIGFNSSEKEFCDKIKIIEDKINSIKNGWVTQILGLITSLTTLLIIVFKGGLK